MKTKIGDINIGMGQFQKREFNPLTNNYSRSSSINDFSWALELLKDGKCVSRSSWDMKRIIVVSYKPLKKDGEITYKKSLQVIDEDGKQISWIPMDADIFANDYIEINDNDSSNDCSGTLIRSMIDRGMI